MVQLKVKKLRPNAKLPERKTDQAAGYDITLALGAGKAYVIEPGDIGLLPVGIACEIPPGWEIQVRARSSFGVKGLGLPHGIGTIDSDYRGEIFVPLMNWSKEPFIVNDGDRIGQMVMKKVYPATVIEVEELDETARGAGGFGSTGR